MAASRRLVVARVLAGVGLLFAILVLPDRPGEWSTIWARFPLELPFAIFLLLLVGRRGFRLMRLVVTAGAAVLLLLKLADIATQTAFARSFNPLLDTHIVIAGWHLLSGTVGRFEAVAAIAAGLVGWALLVAAIHWSLGPLGRLEGRVRILLGATAAAMVAIGAVAIAAGTPGPAEARAAPFLVERLALMRDGVRDLALYGEEIAEDPLDAIPREALLKGLVGRDVVLIFVESYGRSAVEDPRYASAVTDRLAGMEREIAAAGLRARSAWMTSPTMGGQSWLAHATLLSGSWVASQQRYERLIASDRPALNALFRETGWRSVAVMPAITMDWPEAGYFGYDAVHARDDLGYRGKPFNWVTMPDQYTLHAFERLERAHREQPIMAEIALISSHAPWTPVASLVDWDEVGDGTIFTPQAEAGDPPSLVWADPGRVRTQYALTLDYALQVIGSYVARFGKNSVFIVLGDHQPAPIITGENASRDVPVHVIASEDAVLAPFEAYGWSAGMRPAADAPVWRMDLFRERFVRAFSMQSGP